MRRYLLLLLSSSFAVALASEEPAGAAFLAPAEGNRLLGAVPGEVVRDVVPVVGAPASVPTAGGYPVAPGAAVDAAGAPAAVAGPGVPTFLKSCVTHGCCRPRAPPDGEGRVYSRWNQCTVYREGYTISVLCTVR